ncbi:hypothetical protein CUM54_08100 [Enterococcus faecalis]|uniref:Uncharacterized protein n=1 Tax=Enterococcus faecalis TaxID=1351 RepID=A0AAP6RJY5_ENTFL|nr:hypothetical protein [Enterococcus faecalis]EPH80930.1 hypothetical protein D927_01582 [Enterococcus faecalis 02-MB-BW-10]EGO8779500.1 hypothetical protein [Enterococcus faecalis]EGO9191328.1 hypothetical protein [Enterococcus faecalis]MBW9290512.1 hypothetical protein [Enterococcus faecalis]
MLSVFSESKNEYDKKFIYIIEGKIKIVNDKKNSKKTPVLFRREFLKKTFSCLVYLTFCYFLTETNVKKPTFKG